MKKIILFVLIPLIIIALYIMLSEKVKEPKGLVAKFVFGKKVVI